MATTSDATTKDTREMERVDVAADGDLILLIGGVLELRVHSLLLKMNSPVFRTMLGPNWLEGQSLSNISETSPGKLDLPDDDGDGMKYMCYILHHRNEQLGPKNPLSSAFLSIAKTVDKYRCFLATKLAFHTWFSHISPELPTYEHLAAAYVLGDPQWFGTLSRKIILGRTKYKSYVAQCPASTNDEFGIKAALHHRYEYLNNIIGDGVVHAVENLCKFMGKDYVHYMDNAPGRTPEDGEDFNDVRRTTPELCGYHQRMVPIHLSLLVKAGVWPQPDTLKKLIAALISLKLPPFSRLHAEPCEYDYEDDEDWYGEYYQKAIANLSSMACGANAALCLDCLKTPSGKNTGICRKRHDQQVIPNMNSQTYDSVLLRGHLIGVHTALGTLFG